VRFHYRLGWTVALGLARLLLGHRATGGERIPRRGPAIIACNHVSNWDPVLVGLGCPREIHFMAKQELFRNPFLRWLIRAYNALPVRRGEADHRALRLASGVLKRGGALLMFPEGTRSTTGKVGSGKAGVGYLACSTGAPVVPACIVGSSDLKGAMARRTPLRVAFGAPIRPGPAESKDAYAAVTERVMDGIRRMREEILAQ
jgi:1-acyl-sn-glycerol-3-phosphate acyltransferase